ncbi:prolyl oligopeptidase family serine peptidase [Phenylobacterium sp.]|uniref:prolyl oligopeptidase family serine peptidase n=1 Tax=Phenylobacterium sp. TaxID=1871053 RepID=UPI002FC607C7
MAAPGGRQFAWTTNERGRRNIWVAAPGAGGYGARQITNFSKDDGLDLGELNWVPGGSEIIYTRGGTLTGGFLGGADRNPNPTSLAAGASPQEIWAVSLSSGTSRRLAEGRSPLVSPRGDLVAYVFGGQIWVVDLAGGKPRKLLHDNGSPGPQTPGLPPAMAWSPDGARLAFVSQRGDHAFIGVYALDNERLTWLAPSLDTDSNPTWSPDGARVAFMRTAGGGGVFPAPRTGIPWSVIVADARTGEGKAVWRADPGVGSVFTTFDSPAQKAPLMWAAGDNIVFPWEKTGWVHLYAVPARGGEARALTSGQFEVTHSEMAPDRRSIVYASNQGDPDRRHLWRVQVLGGAPTQLTHGEDSEDRPIVSGDGGAIAGLQSGGVAPLRPSVVETDGRMRPLVGNDIPATYPASKLSAPVPVTFQAADGLTLHGQLFLPPKSAGNGPHPALLFFHGGPRKQSLLAWGNEPHNYANCLYLASQGYVVLAVNYRGSSGYGLNFRLPEGFGPAGGSEAADVRAGALYLAGRPDVDKTRIGSWGHSYGGMLTAQGLARSSDLLAAGVVNSALTNWRSLFVKAGFVSPSDTAAGAALVAASPIGAISTWKAPVLLIYNDDDRASPFSQAVELAGALRRQNVEFEQKIIPNEIHNPQMYASTLSIYEATNAFLFRHLERPAK